MSDDDTVIIDLDAHVIPAGQIQVRPVPLGLYPAILLTIGERAPADEGAMTVDVVAAGGPSSFEDIASVLELVAKTIRQGLAK